MSERSKLLLKKGLEQFEREQVQHRHVSILFYNLNFIILAFLFPYLGGLLSTF